MTGQVKEELLSRLLETGVRVVDGEISFDPILLRPDELLPSPEEWGVYTLGGNWETVVVPPRSLGMTVCQIPVVVTLAADTPSIEVTFADGTRREIMGLHIGQETSRSIFERSGRVARVTAHIPDDFAQAEHDNGA